MTRHPRDRSDPHYKESRNAARQIEDAAYLLKELKERRIELDVSDDDIATATRVLEAARKQYALENREHAKNVITRRAESSSIVKS